MSEPDSDKVSRQPNGSEQLQIDQLQFGHSLVKLAVLVVALLFTAVLAVFVLTELWATEMSQTHVTTVGTMFSATTGIIGTLVGTFFGINFGSQGKERAEARRERAEIMAQTAMSALPEDKHDEVHERAQTLYESRTRQRPS